MKKIISFIMAFTICLSLTVTVNAADGGWSAHYQEPETSSNPINRETEYIEITEMEATEHYSGEASDVCHIKFARNKQTNTYLYMENSLNGALDTSKTYDFSFYAKGTFENKGIYAGIGTNENTTTGSMVTFLKTNRYTTEDVANGWKKYTFTNIPYDGNGNHFRIKVVGYCSDMYIDDVVLTVNGGGDDFIVSGGFEEANVAETDDKGNNKMYSPQNFIASSHSSSILLSWKNPADTTLSKVSLYEITSGEEVLLSDTLSKTANDYVNYNVTNLTKGEKYTFKLVCDFASTATETILSATASDSADFKNLAALWMAGNHPGYSYIEYNDVHSGSGALRVISNMKSWTSNNYIKVQTENISFNDEKEYEISLWLKGTFANSSTNINFKDAIKDDSPSSFKYNGETTTFSVAAQEGDWKNVVFKINNTGTKAIAIMGEFKTDLIIDDIEVFELAEGERVTSIFSQDFEGTVNEIADVTDVIGEAGNGKAKISFNAPENAVKVRAYVKNGDELSKRAEIYPQENAIIFNRLKNDYNYTYVLKAVDSQNNESEGVEITLTPTPEAFEIVEYGLYHDGSLAESIEGNTTYTAKATIKNNKIDEGVDTQVITIVRKDGVRIDANASEIKNVSKSRYDAPGTDIEASITVGDLDDGEYEISVYLWDGLGNMKILAPYKLYKETVE